MTITVSPTNTDQNTHFISLTDSSGTEVGFITTDSLGEKKYAVSVAPYPTMASQLRQGKGKYSDRVPPFEDIPLSDFSGGLAMLHHDEDSSRYLDGKRCDTTAQGRVIHGGLETYTTGLRDFNQSWPGDVSWDALDNATTNLKSSFVCDALDDTSYDAQSVILILRKTGTPTGNITVQLLDASDVQVGSATKSLAVGTDCLTDLVSERVEFEFTTAETLTHGTTYKVSVTYSSGSSTSYVDVAVDGSGNPYYRVLDDTGDFNFKTFEYKNAFYGITVPDDGTVSKMYMLGDRGAADSNTGALTTLVDATKSWTADEWIGDVVIITNGDGKLEEQPWRTITDNDGTSLTVSPAWTVVHDTSTEYVILSDKWKLKQTLTARAHDVKTVGKFVYIAFGYAGGAEIGGGSNADLYIRRYREYNDSGTWTEEIAQEDNNYYGAEKILGIMSTDTSKHEVTIADFYMASETPYGTSVSKFQIPYTWEDMVAVQGVLCNNTRAWTDTIYTNSVPNPYYYGSIVNVGDSFTTGKCAHWKLSSALDIRNAEAILMHMNINPAGAGTSNYTDAGDIRLVLADSSGSEDEYNLDGTIEEWYDELIFLLDPGTANADMSDITDLYWKINSDEGQVIINVWGSILLVGDRGLPYRRWHSLESGEIVNHIIEYGGGAGEVTRKPWILTDRNAHYIEDDVIKTIYLSELNELRHPRSGEGACVNDVYLWFNIGPLIQRYYAGKLDNRGPDVDYGLPENRQGIPCTMASYPGRVYAGIDAGDNYSSVIVHRNHGWHEVYRGVKGDRIRNIHIVGRVDTSDRIYISEGADVLWIPISISPETEEDYEYVWESVLETSRIYGGLRETEKYYHAITLVTENLAAGKLFEVDYKTSEDSDWINISTDFTSSPRQRQALASTNDTTGRWIQFRFRSYTNDRTVTPVLVSAILDALERLDSANTYTYFVRLKDGVDQDLLGKEETQRGYEKWDQVETWVDDPKPLTLKAASNFENGKLVFIEPERSRMLYKKMGDTGQEVRIYQLTIIEVE